jgi:hypothetical protein
MRSLPILFVLTVAACATPVASGPPPAATQSPREYLLGSAAADFKTHPPKPTRFRNVRFGHLAQADGSPQYFVCGEYEDGAGAWVPFATIKTSGYEQYLGGGSTSYCSRPSTVWEVGDLSSALQDRVAADSTR